MSHDSLRKKKGTITFGKRNNVNQQCDLIINQCLTKVTLWWKISELDAALNYINDVRKRIAIHDLKFKYRSFIIVIQEWLVQPSMEEIENFLAIVKRS